MISFVKVPALLAPQPDPTTLKTKPWAGKRLARIRGLGSHGSEKIGESWEFSTLAGSESIACGKPLSQLLQRDLPFLAKLLDTAAPLSVQVHPDDDPISGVNGKEEAWVILDADKNAHVWVGLKQNLSRRSFEVALEQVGANPENSSILLTCLERYEVQAGDVVLVPAGAVHAIGAGIFLAEIQQPSDQTYRLFDYGSKRPLHIDSALKHLRNDAVATFLDARGRISKSSISAKHLRLEVFGPGEHQILEPEQDRLIISAVGESEATADELHIKLERGELLLWTRANLCLRVAAHSLAVVAWTKGHRE